MKTSSVHVTPAPSAEYRHAARSANGFTGLINQAIGAAVAPVCVRLGMTPNLITIAGGMVQLFTATLLYLQGASVSWMMVIAIGLLWQFGYGLDCADGQVARVHKLTSPVGAWLDQMVDFLSHCAIITSVILYVAKSLVIDIDAAMLLLAFVLTSNLVLLFATSQKGTLIGDSPAISSDMGSLWQAAKRMKHLADYGLYLFVTAAALPWPELELVVQILWASFQLASFLGLAAAITRSRG